MSGKLLIAIIIALGLYIAATKTKVSVQPQVKMPETRFLPKIIKLPEIEIIPQVTIDVAEKPPEPEVEPHKFIPSIDSALLCDTCGEAEGSLVHIKQPVVTYTQPQPVSQVQYSCGPNGCYVVPQQAQQYRTYQPRGFRPIRRLFGRR